MLKLVKMSKKYISQLFNMMDEWTNANEKIIPWSIRKCDYHDIDNYIASLEVKEAYEKYVPDSTYFLLDTQRNIFLGAVNIRHYLNVNCFWWSYWRWHKTKRKKQGLWFKNDSISIGEM